MCFTVPLLAVLSIAGAVRSADPGASIDMLRALARLPVRKRA